MELVGDAFMLKSLLNIVKPDTEFTFYSMPNSVYTQICTSEEYKKAANAFHAENEKNGTYVYLHPSSIFQMFSGTRNGLSKDEVDDINRSGSYIEHIRISEYITGRPFLSMGLGQIICKFNKNGLNVLFVVEGKHDINKEFKDSCTVMDDKSLKEIDIYSKSSLSKGNNKFVGEVVSYVRKEVKKYLEKPASSDKNFTLNPLLRINSYDDEAEEIAKGLSKVQLMRILLNSNKDKFAIAHQSIDNTKNELMKMIASEDLPKEYYVKFLKKYKSVLAKNGYVFDNKELSLIPQDLLEDYDSYFPQFKVLTGNTISYEGKFVEAYEKENEVLFHWNSSYLNCLTNQSQSFLYKNRFWIVNAFLHLAGIDTNAVKKSPLGGEIEVYTIYNIANAKFPYDDFLNKDDMTKDKVQISFLKFLEFIASNEDEVARLLKEKSFETEIIRFMISKTLEKEMKEDQANSPEKEKIKSKVRKY